MPLHLKTFDGCTFRIKLSNSSDYYKALDQGGLGNFLGVNVPFFSCWKK